MFDLVTVQVIPLPFAQVKLATLSVSGTVPVTAVSVALTGVSATVSLGSLSIQGNVAVTPTGVSATVYRNFVGQGRTSRLNTMTVVNVGGYNNKYYIAGLTTGRCPNSHS